MKQRIVSTEYRTFITGALLTGLVLFAFAEKMYRYNAWGELFGSSFDITYFSMAIPFYVACISCSVTCNEHAKTQNASATL